MNSNDYNVFFLNVDFTLCCITPRILCYKMINIVFISINMKISFIDMFNGIIINSKTSKKSCFFKYALK